MKIIDPGHCYEVDSYDGEMNQLIDFMKRIGDKFPGNEGSSCPGTNCQELIRILIDRCKYLNNQIPCIETEDRALRIKGLAPIIWPLEIENLSPCNICGHIYPHTCEKGKI